MNNTMVTSSMLDIHKLINEEKILSHFQPIVSISKLSISGLEALSRGVSDTGNLIQPSNIFVAANEHGLLPELNHLCIKKAIQNYSENQCSQEPSFLTINFEISYIDNPQRELESIVEVLDQCGVSPSSIVVEILESKASSTQILENFVCLAREFGFMVALDDFGAGYSNFDRITTLKPDILKIDRSLISGIDQHFFKQEVVHSLITLSHKFGALVIAEGVETEQEAITCLELGADMMQGYYFLKPQESIGDLHSSIKDVITPIAQHYKTHMIEKTTDKINRYRSYDTIVSHITYQFSDLPVEQFTHALYEWVNKRTTFECLYILNEQGIQITDTVLGRTFQNSTSLLYAPAQKGADHSNKPYFFFIFMGMKKYVTDSYISLATGRLCITISVPFISRGKQYLLCADISPDL